MPPYISFGEVSLLLLIPICYVYFWFLFVIGVEKLCADNLQDYFPIARNFIHWYDLLGIFTGHWSLALPWRFQAWKLLDMFNLFGSLFYFLSKESFFIWNFLVFGLWFRKFPSLQSDLILQFFDLLTDIFGRFINKYFFIFLLIFFRWNFLL